MDPQPIIIASNDAQPGTFYQTPEGHYIMAVPVEDTVSDPGQCIINVPMILTADGGLGGSIQMDSLDQGSISIEDSSALNTHNLVIRAPVKKQPVLTPGAQLVFVSDEASGQRLIFTTNGGKLEGPFAIETPVINSAITGDIGAALSNIAFTTNNHQNVTAELTAQNYIQTAPIIIPSLEQSFLSRHVPEREHRILVEDEVQPPQAGPLRCDICNKEFSQWSHKRKHDIQHLMDKPYNCKKCSSTFNYEHNLQLHEVIHLDSLQWSCPICKRNFKRLAGYKAHILIHEKEESLTCEHCGEEFATQKYLDIHINNDHRDENEIAEEITISYECAICRRVFNKRTDFKDHMKDHSKLQQSLKISQARKPMAKRRLGNFKCKMCERRFIKPSLLKRHWLTHSGERPYKCQECSQAFSQKGSLILHNLLHKGVRPFKCNFCDFTFTQRGNLRSHIARTHMLPMPGEFLYQCHQCPCVFRKIGPLNSHITKFHFSDNPPSENQENFKLQPEATDAVPNVLNSDILQQAIAQSGLQNAQAKKDDVVKSETQVIADSKLDGTTRHYQVKVRRVNGVRWHQCLYCVKEFKKPSDLLRHMRTHTNEKPYKCDVCLRNFTVRSTLLVHLHTHGPQRSMQCEVCKKKYSAASSLAHHMKSHLNTKTVNCEHCNKTYTYTGNRDTHQCEELKRIALERRRKKILENKQLEEKLKDSLPYLQDPLFASEKGLIAINRKKGSAPGRPEEFAERPYVCARCNCRFKKRSHLRAHEASHDGIKRFLCNDCGKPFSSKPALKHHIVVMHTNSGITFECSVCGLRYSTKGCLQRHMLCHSNQKHYICPYCEKQFSYSSACRQHIKTHVKEVLSNSEKNKNNLKAAVLVSKGDHMPQQQQQTLVELVNAVEQRTVSVINAPTHFNQIGHQILTKYSVQMTEPMPEKMMISDALVSKAVAEVIPQIINTTVSNMQGDIHLSLIQKQSHILGLGKPIDEFSLLDQPGVSTSQGMVPVETSIFIQGFDGQTLDPTFLTGGIPIQTDPIEMGTLTKMLASTSEPAPQEDQYSCEICKKIFMDSESYKAHHVEHVLVCLSCDARFDTQDSLDMHVKSVHENMISLPKNFKCGYCHAGFYNTRQLQGHISKLHNKRSLLRKPIPLTSSISSEQLGEASSPKKDAVRRLTQEEAHDMEKSLLAASKPSVSEFVFLESLKEATRKSEEESAKEMPEPDNTILHVNNCHLCTKTFRKPSDLTRHVRTHTGEKPFVCSHCGKGFAVKSTLVAHWLVHKKGAAAGLPCHICSAKFATKGSLRIHMRIHTGSRPLKCPHCPSNFRTSGHRKSHISAAHKTHIKKTIITPECEPMMTDQLETIEEEPATAEEVEEAVSALHTDQDQSENQLPINLESSEFLQLDENLIQQVHPGNFVFFPTDTDGFIRFEVFSDMAGQQLIGEIAGPSMETQQKKEADNKSCVVCGKSFSKPSQLVRHMRIHSGEKPFPCTMCDKRFNQKNALKAHTLTHMGLKKYRCIHCDKNFTQAGNLKTHVRRTHPELS